MFKTDDEMRCVIEAVTGLAVEGGLWTWEAALVVAALSKALGVRCQFPPPTSNTGVVCTVQRNEQPLSEAGSLACHCHISHRGSC